VPAGTPKDIVDLLSRQIAKMVLLPDVKERLATLGFSPLAGTSQELAAYIKAESAEWRRVVREAKINVD
jgi:tripartite-type tricarboxylate transporter receptor subunit TctC